MRVLKIVEGTSVDGPGLRTSIYLAGCNHYCPGCHNPQSWHFDGGREMSQDELLLVLAENEAPVTLTGGDPLAQPRQVEGLVRRIKDELGLNVWCYTGYTWGEIVADEALRAAVAQVDVVVDGRFVLAERDTTLLFRGSRNQRLIDVAATLAAGEVKLFDPQNNNLFSAQ